MTRETRDGLADKLKEIGFKSDWENNIHVIDYLAIADFIIKRDQALVQAVAKFRELIGKRLCEDADCGCHEFHVNQFLKSLDSLSDKKGGA